MKLCPNVDCSRRRKTGEPAEFEDDVSRCAHCGTELVSVGPTTTAEEAEPSAVVARFSSPHEAHAATAALAAHDIDAVVDQEHSPFVSTIPWVRVRVAQSNADAARTVLERGPIQSSERDAATTLAARPTLDEMSRLRIRRRITLARWFLYIQAIGGALGAFVPLVGVLGWCLFLVSIGLALWSIRDPRRAFGVALVFQLVATVATIAMFGITALTGIVIILALYFGWSAAGAHPPDELSAGPRSDAPPVEIGDAWRRAGPAEQGPPRTD